MSLPAFNNFGPVTLKAEDRPAEDPQALVIELTATLRTQTDELAYLLSVLRDTSRDVGRRIYLAEAQGQQAIETAGRVRESVERLSRAIRAAGRL